MTAVAAKPDFSNVSAQAARDKAAELQETARNLHAENSKLLAALSWMEDYDPELVAAARYKFEVNG